jgi:broad specificity phosphatase PhoE
VTDLLLLRHGESEWNALGRWQGQADPPLSDLGRRQARQAAALLPCPGRVVSSDLQRAAATADIIASRHGLEVAGRPTALRERHAGPWQGRTHDEIESGWPGMLASGSRPAGFEGDDDILARVVPALEALADASGPDTSGCVTAGSGVPDPDVADAVASGSGNSSVIVVVTHGGVLRALERAHGIDGPRIPNLGGRWWRRTNAGLDPGAAVLLVGGESITRPEET